MKRNKKVYVPMAVDILHTGHINIINAAQHCNDQKIDLITLSGFKDTNPLNQMGKVNFHVNSEDYNFIEMTHHIILVSIVDIFTKKLH